MKENILRFLILIEQIYFLKYDIIVLASKVSERFGFPSAVR